MSEPMSDERLALVRGAAAPYAAEIIQIRARVAELEGQVQRVRQEHRPSSPGIDGWETEWCPCCDVEWPCQTIRTLDGSEPTP